MTLSSEQWKDSAIHIYVLPQIPLPSRLPHNTGKVPCAIYIAGPCWLSILVYSDRFDVFVFLLPSFLNSVVLTRLAELSDFIACGPRSPLLPGTRTSCSASDISDPLTSSRSAHVTQVVTSVDPSLIKTVTPRSSLQHYWFHLPLSTSSFFPHNTSTWTTTSNLFVYLFWLLFVLSYQTICSTEAWNFVNLVN